jgi:hypothetical protein
MEFKDSVYVKIDILNKMWRKYVNNATSLALLA